MIKAFHSRPVSSLVAKTLTPVSVATLAVMLATPSLLLSSTPSFLSTMVTLRMLSTSVIWTTLSSFALPSQKRMQR